MATPACRQGGVAPPPMVGETWEHGMQEAMLGLRDWRALHPSATLAEIEAELDGRWHRLRAQMLTDLALASTATELAAGPRPRCPGRGGPLPHAGGRGRTVGAAGDAPATPRPGHAPSARR